MTIRSDHTGALPSARPETRPRQLRLVDITPDNWRSNLAVREDQTRFVANHAVLLARAYAYRAQRSRAFLVCDGDRPVGMGLYYDCPELAAYDFSQLFIDAHWQGRGYGRAAVELVLEALRRDGVFDRVVLCYVEGNDSARRLYERFGFVETDRDGDEIGMELSLS